MKINECPFERQIRTAITSDRWTDDLRHHAANCALCQETMTMTMMINKISNVGASHTLPSYQLIWLKAQYARKQERLSMLDILSLVGLSLSGIIGFLGFLLWRFPKFLPGIFETTGASAISWKSVVSSSGSFALIAAVCIMIWLFTRDNFFAER